MSNLPIGQIITTQQHRDAIHVAVAPVVAGEQLMPATRVRFEDGKAVEVIESRLSRRDGAIGIVDPFLTRPVEVGQTFWLFLFPGTITALRHEWTHPAFAPEEAGSVSLRLKAESEDWLRRFCMEHEGLDYDDMIIEMAKEDGYTVQQGSESARTEGVSPEFRHHFRIVTGQEVLGHFSCSC